MTHPDRQLHFNSCIDHLDLAWRIEGSDPRWLFDMEQLVERARLAEKGLMNAMFIADFYTYRPGFSLEPVTLLSALAAATKHIGMIASVSTTYNEPYNLARMFASLDRLSNGRVGWNMVTTAIGTVSENYSRPEHLEHDTRYERAHEVIDVVTKLWDSLDEDALDYTPEGYLAADPEKIRVLDHKGEWLEIKGPLDIPRPIQGNPVRQQAGSSQAGRDFGARWAEVIFTAQPVLSVAQEFYADIRRRMAAFGRTPDQLNILPGLMPILARTRAEAEAMLAARQENAGDALARMKEMVGIDLSQLPPDEPIPLDLLPERGVTNGMRGRSDLYLDLVRKHRLTPRQLSQQGAHLAFAGTPEDTADLIYEWYTNYGCDGFTLMWPSLEANILFVEDVVPILQRRGIYRTAYTGTTLREHFGLARPQKRAFTPREN